MLDPEESPIFFDWPDRTALPLIVPWPTRGNIGGMLEFRAASEWLAFLRQHDLHPAVPLIVSAKYRRAQKLYTLAWLEFDLIKAGELVALTALELALRDRYGARAPKRGRHPATLEGLLRYMVEGDGLTDGALSFVRKYGGSVLPHLYETDAARTARQATQSPPQTTLAAIRNSMAHGDPFDGLPWSGLLELVRDLIHYAYRDMISEMTASSVGKMA
ncbi:MAG: hypothetical protein J0H82_13280 [Alphaproteobacteria bacterium]|jgi:hypothetical protein|uniref:hypothetical protein n=1 Tax=Sphingomonas sp. GlSt437 TaxID=3389970 RepID=UPI001ACEEFA8|nr:hypothetical protein [Alphaproteobacteria bacterium]HWB51278.1 hypothetical protein [Stellaceae bacterium]